MSKVNKGCTCPKLTLKVPITTAANIFLLFFIIIIIIIIIIIFQRKQVLTFHVNCLLENKLVQMIHMKYQTCFLADNSHEMSRLVFS